MEPLSRPTSCPDGEVLAAFLDGRLDARARAEVESHLAACEACRETFVEAIRFLEQVGPASPIERPRIEQHRPRPALLAGLAAAAGLATIGILLIRTLPPAPARVATAPARVSPPVTSSPVPAQGPSPQGDLHKLVRSAWTEHGAAYGFAGTRTSAGTARLVGVHRTDVALALQAGDMPAARGSLDRLLAVLPAESPSAREYQQFGQELAAGRRPVLPAHAGPDAARVALGEWLEAARLAAIVHDRGFFETPRAREALPSLAGASPAASRKVTEIERMLGTRPMGDETWEDLARSLADLIRMP